MNETADGSANDVGWYSSLAIDTRGNPHVAYKDETTDDLKYARKSGGLWSFEIADGSANNVGHYASLVLDALGAWQIDNGGMRAPDLAQARFARGFEQARRAAALPVKAPARAPISPGAP